MKNDRVNLWQIFRNFSNPRTPGHGESKHRGGSPKPHNWRRDKTKARKRQRQAKKQARRTSAGRKHRK